MSTETPETPEVLEPVKPSRLKKIKSAALVAGFYGTCAAVTAGSIYASIKTSKNQLEAAKLALEAAKINHP